MFLSIILIVSIRIWAYGYLNFHSIAMTVFCAMMKTA